MAENIMRALSRYAPDLLLLLALYLLLLRRWAQQGGPCSCTPRFTSIWRACCG